LVGGDGLANAGAVVAITSAPLARIAANLRFIFHLLPENWLPFVSFKRGRAHDVSAFLSGPLDPEREHGYQTAPSYPVPGTSLAQRHTRVYPRLERALEGRSIAMEGGERFVERGPLTLRISDDVGSVLRVEAMGELDLSNAQALDKELERAMETSAERIIVDLSGLEFIDSTGIAALGRIETHHGTERFGLIRAPEQVQRVIALTGLERALPFLD
jgi:anti-sigma B factor antagonist